MSRPRHERHSFTEAVAELLVIEADQSDTQSYSNHFRSIIYGTLSMVSGGKNVGDSRFGDVGVEKPDNFS